ncbi:hypothetical protein BHYA_0157g00050 [Botrytis hyacinthi]|uniref:C2H2-type domain-containing protein n=1 Tax=Botrytis hyacinthi TaxID=278943 RepID=A0A4Z1GNW6_9HELO|nr:hypothetical protein BHYA_0157g00050 [Botrytis hyacinthi]
MSSSRRPSMKGRDSSGREVSLLNSSTTEISPSPVSQSQSQLPQLPFRQPSYDSYASQRFSQKSYPPSSPHMVRTNSNASITSLNSVPSLLRSDSYDSYEARSPLTPTFTPNAHARNHSFTEQYGKETPFYERNSMDEYRPYSTQKSYQSTNVQQYSDEQYYHEDSSYPGVTERGPGKRYSCRYKELHNCNKTFTTSGHASRHAKIHTAEKMVCCTFTGCMKKFTRADNMKQHLDTHYKDKPRSASSSASSGGRLNGKSTLTMPARVQKKASPSIHNLQSPRPRMPSRILTSEIPPFDLRDQQQFQPQQDPFYTQMGSGPSPTQTDFQSLPTRSKSPNRLDILAQAASGDMI